MSPESNANLVTELLSRIRELIPRWLPGGRTENGKYFCKNLLGGRGDGVVIDLQTGVWHYKCNGVVMFGSDLIKLFAAVESIAYNEAAERLEMLDPKPLDLVGLEDLQALPASPVLIVDNEKCAVAAREIVGARYVVVTWPNEAGIFSRADWAPVFGRRVLIWPTADELSLESAVSLANYLVAYGTQVKVLMVANMDGWNAHIAVAAGCTWKTFSEFARPVVKEFVQQTETWEQKLYRFISEKTETTMTEIGKAMQLPSFDESLQKKIGRILMRAGWSKFNLRREGRQMKVWKRAA